MPGGGGGGGVSLRVCVERRCPCLRVCGAVFKRETDALGLNRIVPEPRISQLDPANCRACTGGQEPRRGEKANLRFAHIRRSSAALAALTGGSQCQRVCLGLSLCWRRVCVRVGAKGGLFLRRRGSLMYVCMYVVVQVLTDLIVCVQQWAVGGLDMSPVLRLLERERERDPGPCVCTCVLPEGCAAGCSAWAWGLIRLMQAGSGSWLWR